MHLQRKQLRGSLARRNITSHAMLDPSGPDDWSYLHVHTRAAASSLWLRP